MRLQLPANHPQESVFFQELVKKVQKNTAARPSVGLDRTVHRRSVLDLRRHPILRPALVVDLLVLVLYSHGDIKVGDFQTEVPVNKKVIGLEVPVSDSKTVKKREAIDEGPADLNDTLAKFLGSVFHAIRDRVHFGQNDPCPGLRVERVNQRDDILGLRLDGIKMSEDLEFVRSFANSFCDEFLARLQ